MITRLGNPAFVIGVIVVFALYLALFAAALRFDRFDRWAASRGLRWHWMGGGSSYLWPEDDRQTGRSVIARALLSLAAVLLVAIALGVFLFVVFR